MKKRLIISAALTVVASAFVATTATAANRSELYGQRSSLFELLPVDSTDIVFFGNSLTMNCEWNELFNMPNIKNRGIIGDTADGLYDRVDPIIAGHPAKIFMLCGVNDISHNLSADTIASNILKVVEKIRRETPTTRLYVQSLVPFNQSFNRYHALDGKEQVGRDINKILHENASKYGYTFINSRPIFADADDNLDRNYSNDGLHLLGPAYLEWRDFLLPYVLE